ncbi:MAG: protein-ADP-ribose hydrolase [Firmicutes bacterium]|nr:protein-ADP-ribose hydrolase [Bacillota bacterium]
MTHDEARIYLIREMIHERGEDEKIEIPAGAEEQKKLLRALFNVRPPMRAPERFLSVQNEYLREEIRSRGITDSDSLCMNDDGMCIWQGDITTLRCDAIVNAANSQLLGCFYPNHGCIDNAIHTFAGVELRLECERIMSKQGHEEAVGDAKITSAYCLPCRYVIHTVGPMVFGAPGAREREQLSSCYRACLETAVRHSCKNIAFCCISTGEFHFPNREAAKIAVNTVVEYKERTKSKIEVIFNVWKDIDREIYGELLR